MASFSLSQLSLFLFYFLIVYLLIPSTRTNSFETDFNTAGITGAVIALITAGSISYFASKKYIMLSKKNKLSLYKKVAILTFSFLLFIIGLRFWMNVT